MKFLELAHKILLESKRPMSASEIWEYGTQKNYISELKSSGRTPSYTLASRLYSAANDSANKTFNFLGVRPKRFYLTGVTPEISLKIDEEAEMEREERISKLTFKEHDLHCALAYFSRTHFDAFPKTINHSKSRKKEFGEWSHPDMVACYFPRLHWKTNVYELSQLLGDVQLGFYSFEIKLRLSFANLRESFFQAVSNSSWAHLGYLAAAEVSMEPDFLEELGRLSRAFGIGIIRLDIKDPDASEIIYDAEQRELIDWDTVNKLSTMNNDFSEFINRIKKDVASKEIREEWYDKLLEPEDIIAKLKTN